MKISKIKLQIFTNLDLNGFVCRLFYDILSLVKGIKMKKSNQTQIENNTNQNSQTDKDLTNQTITPTNKTNAKLTKKENIIQTLKFVGFSVSAGVIQILSFTFFSQLIFKDAGNEYGWSYFISLILSIVWNFTLNREFTFKSANNVPIAMLLVLLFYVFFTPLSTIAGQALTNVGWNEFLVLALTMILNMILEFVYCRFVVYRNSINTNKRAQKQSTKK